MAIDAAYQYLDAGKTMVNKAGVPLQGPLKGEYDTNEIHFYAVNLVWKF